MCNRQLASNEPTAINERDNWPVTRFSYSENDPITLTINFIVRYWGVEIFRLGKNNAALISSNNRDIDVTLSNAIFDDDSFKPACVCAY